MVYKRYSWRVHHGVPAEVAGKVMEEIQERDGEVTKEAFLEESRPEDSPTHGCFEWDDSVAAERFRLHQSQMCILDLVVRVEKVNEDKPRKAPAFINVSSEKKARYTDIEQALSKEDSRRIVLQNALKELETFREKYEGLVELTDVFAAIIEVERRIK